MVLYYRSQVRGFTSAFKHLLKWNYSNYPTSILEEHINFWRNVIPAAFKVTKIIFEYFEESEDTSDIILKLIYED